MQYNYTNDINEYIYNFTSDTHEYIYHYTNDTKNYLKLPTFSKLANILPVFEHVAVHKQITIDQPVSPPYL